jgi:hypothetical protein
MGLRSWLTPVNTPSELEKVSEFAAENYGMHYVIQINRDGTPFEKGTVLVAWSGDGSSSLEGLEPEHCCKNTWLLDNLLELCPEWHEGEDGPGKFGNIIDPETQQPDWESVKKSYNQGKTASTESLNNETMENKIDVKMVSRVSAFLGESISTIQGNLVAWDIQSSNGSMEVHIDFEKKELGFVDWLGNYDDKLYFALVGVALNYGFTTAEYWS